METVLAAIITGGLTLAGTIIAVRESQRKTETTMKMELAVMRTELNGLRKEVERHNNFAVRIPTLEAQELANAAAIQRLESFHME